MRTDRELIDLVRAVAENGHISFQSAECERILELLELGRDVATIDARAVSTGSNVPQVQRGLVGESWDVFAWCPGAEGRVRFVGKSPAEARAYAAAAMRLNEGLKP